MDAPGLAQATGGRDAAQWPLRLGPVPPLADGFSARPRTAAGLLPGLRPGATIMLVPGQAAGPQATGRVLSPGTTQLAVYAAESLWRAGQIELLVWVPATSRAAVLAGYAAAAAAVLAARPAAASGDAEAAAARFTAWLATADRPWLVVLDDLPGPGEIAGLWPAGPAGRVMITAREPVMAADHRAAGFGVTAFSPDESLSYLLASIGAEPAGQEHVARLAAELRGEPLALAQASAVITSAGWSCRDYLDAFTGRRAGLPGGGQPGGVGPGGVGPAAAVTWTLSAEQAGRLAPDGTAGALLALAALLDGHAIPAAVFAAEAARGYLAGEQAGEPVSAGQASSALLALRQAGLLSTGQVADVPAAWMSAGVQAAIRDTMPESALARAAHAAAGALLQVWPDTEAPAWLGAALRSSADCLRRAAGDLLWAGTCHPLLLRAGQSLDAAGLTGAAVGHWAWLTETGQRLLGRGHPDTLAAGERLAAALLAAGQPDEAISRLDSLLADRIRVLGPAHPSAISARRNLGHALATARRFTDSIAALDRVVADYQRVRGGDHPDTLAARDELAAVQLTAGRAGDAARLGQDTVTIRERVQGPQHPDTLVTRLRLADAYLAGGRAKQALAAYKQVLAERAGALGPDHLDTIAARAALGSAYYQAGRMAAAIECHEQAQAAYTRLLGASHPGTLAGNLDLAEAYQAVGRVTDAVTLLRDTLQRGELVLPAGDPLPRTARERLAGITGQ